MKWYAGPGGTNGAFRHMTSGETYFRLCVVTREMYWRDRDLGKWLRANNSLFTRRGLMASRMSNFLKGEGQFRRGPTPTRDYHFNVDC